MTSAIPIGTASVPKTRDKDRAYSSHDWDRRGYSQPRTARFDAGTWRFSESLIETGEERSLELGMVRMARRARNFPDFLCLYLGFEVGRLVLRLGQNSAVIFTSTSIHRSSAIPGACRNRDLGCPRGVAMGQ